MQANLLPYDKVHLHFAYTSFEPNATVTAMLLLFCLVTSWTQKAFQRPLSTWPLASLSEVESSRTSLASRTSSRTHFEVLGLGLEASSPRKLACPRLEDRSIFWIVKILWSAWKIFWKTVFRGYRLKNFREAFFFFRRSPEKFLWRPFFSFFGEQLRLCPWSLASSFPVLGLESVCPRRGCPWPWPWPRIFFVSLALASSLMSSTPPLQFINVTFRYHNVNSGFCDSKIFNTYISVKLAIAYIMIWCFIL